MIEITDPQTLHPLFYLALSTEKGIRIPTTNPHRLKELLNKLRTKIRDPLLSDIHIIISPRDPGGELWMVLNVKKEKAIPTETERNPHPNPSPLKAVNSN